MNICKDFIENISGIKIRRGFEKFIYKSICFLNIDKFDEEGCIGIVEFINSSNSKLSESYFVLRTNISKIKYDKIIEKYREDFIKSPYKNTNHRKVAKKFTSKNHSRGYSGYAIINNKKYFCRSSIEFIYMWYLCNELYKDDNYTIKKEEKIYCINGDNYKPDVFVYDNNSLIKIIEIKGDKKIEDRYLNFNVYFDKIGIEYKILCEPQLILKKYPYIKNKLEEWKKEEAYIKKDMRGKNNPRYGIKTTEETKKKISEGIKKAYRDNEEYGKRLSERVRNFYRTKEGEKVKEKLRKMRKRKAEENQIKKDKEDPIIEKICKTCGDKFKVRTSENERVTCRKNGCTYKYNLIMGKVKLPRRKEESNIKNYQRRIINCCKLFNRKIESFNMLKNLVKEYKNNGLIHTHFGMNKETILKYFNSLEELNEEINKWED